jgi:hypothetical protein
VKDFAEEKKRRRAEEISERVGARQGHRNRPPPPPNRPARDRRAPGSVKIEGSSVRWGAGERRRFAWGGWAGNNEMQLNTSNTNSKREQIDPNNWGVEDALKAPHQTRPYYSGETHVGPTYLGFVFIELVT